MEMGHLVPGKPPSTGRLELEGRHWTVYGGGGPGRAGARPARSRERVRQALCPWLAERRGTSVVVTGGLARRAVAPQGVAAKDYNAEIPSTRSKA